MGGVLQKKKGTYIQRTPPPVPLGITPTFRPWTHTPDDSYIYQLSLVLATATVSSVSIVSAQNNRVAWKQHAAMEAYLPILSDVRHVDRGSEQSSAINLA